MTPAPAKITIDRDLCEGHGLCVLVAPALLRLDAAGEVEILTDDVSDRIELARRAVRACPAIALRLE